MSATHGACARAHDAANVPVLTLIALACVAGVAGALDPLVVTRGVPGVHRPRRAVDRALAAVACRARRRWLVAHHVVTAALLAHPLRHPERAIETCRNGLVEANTLFFDTAAAGAGGGARRTRCGTGCTSRRWRRWRFAWQPYLLWHFYANVTKDDVWWEKAQVCGGADVF